jgi:ribosomal protein S18 acetylase RimI-like enzyme
MLAARHCSEPSSEAGSTSAYITLQNMKNSTEQGRAGAYQVRAAIPNDIPALMRLKRALAESENALHAVRASPADWLRDGFGPRAGFSAFVAETDEGVVGMATCSRRTITGWNGPVLFLQDLFVEPAHRRRGIARALTARVAAFACELGSPLVELTVRADNPAQIFYRQNGFAPLPQCLTYVLAGPALAALAARDDQNRDGTTPLPLAG